MAIIAQFLIGLIFGLGLVLSGMSDPAKVLNFSISAESVRASGIQASHSSWPAPSRLRS
jgi:hypothetical protein